MTELLRPKVLLTHEGHNGQLSNGMATVRGSLSHSTGQDDAVTSTPSHQAWAFKVRGRTVQRRPGHREVPDELSCST